jgi:hypothetical protein
LENMEGLLAKWTGRVGGAVISMVNWTAVLIYVVR